MNLRKIKALQKKAAKEAQKAVDDVFKKYNKEMKSLIKDQLPKGTTLHSINGCAYLMDKDGNEIDHGTAWSIYTGNHRQLEYIAGLQYNEDYQGTFNIDQEIVKK